MISKMRRALESVNERILTAVQKRNQSRVDSNGIPRLVAVSKLKPASMIVEAYQCGQRHFGENYIQELEEKSVSKEILDHCPDIKFHFIGHLQSNKVNRLLRVRNLFMVESVDSIKLADLIDRAIRRQDSSLDDNQSATTSNFRIDSPLKVMIQVNTSGEDQKGGIKPDQVINLAGHIQKHCSSLELAGLMTIGRLDGWPEDSGPNKDFLKLVEVKNEVSKHLSVSQESLELSMGMSGDFEEAITLGSTNVRVGSLIFGERPPKS